MASAQFETDRPVRLAIEAVGVKHSGGATVLLDLLDEIECDPRIRSVSLFCSQRKRRLFTLDSYSKVAEICVQPAESPMGRFFWMRNGLARAVERVDADVLLCFNGVGRGSRGIPKACFIQQSLLLCAEALSVSRTCDRLRCWVIRKMMADSLGTAERVFAQTPTMRSWIAEGFNIPRDHIAVITPSVRDFPLAGDSDIPPIMRAAPPDRRLLYVGNASNYKNVNLVISGMRRVRQRIPGSTLFVTWPADHPACAVEGIAGVGYLTGANLPAAYKAASAFVLPSLVESGNVTMMEAMSVGTPVLAADRPYAHDLCEDAAVFFDPRDPDAFAEAAIHILTDEALRSRLSRRGFELVQRRRESRPYRILLDHLCGLAEKNIVLSPAVMEAAFS
jgi:glycosyltransferase involved in cell wall biosynthesis